MYMQIFKKYYLVICFGLIVIGCKNNDNESKEKLNLQNEIIESNLDNVLKCQD